MIPDDPRAARLFSQLDGRYFEFTDRLPSPLQKLARLENTFRGNRGEQPLESVESFNPVLVATPWLFWDLFQGLEDPLFLKIAEAGMFFVLASVILDHLVDQQAEHPQVLSLLHQSFYHQGVTIFRTCLPAVSSFWGHFDRLAACHIEGLTNELETQVDGQSLDLDTFSAMAYGKVAPIVNTVAALAFASGQPALLDFIEASLNHIAVASQLLDDIGDWQHDLKVGHRTYYLNQCIPPDVWLSAELGKKEIVQSSIHKNWADVTNMHRVVDYLDEAVSSVKDLNCPDWIDYVDIYRQRADRHLTQFYLTHVARAFKS